MIQVIYGYGIIVLTLWFSYMLFTGKLKQHFPAK